ncbi:MAG: mannose-1-phosphate guanylyltransferase [Thermoguttaceae bacterium]
MSLHAVILAGGSGTRLWPESRISREKQFLSFDAIGKTLLEATLERLDSLVNIENQWILCGESMVPRIKQLIPNFPMSHLLVEPVARNTAPCIGLAAAKLMKIDPDATMLVLPADHLIAPNHRFGHTMRKCLEILNTNQDSLVTIGVRPTFPSTSYGYIQAGKESPPSVFQVVRFCEKPTQEVATEFLASNQFFWNAGIFLWKARQIFELLCKFEPEMSVILNSLFEAMNNQHETQTIQKLFPKLKKISIDYAVLEKAESIFVVAADFSWDDVGTWRSLERLHHSQKDILNESPPDEHGNLIFGAKLCAIDSSGNLIRAHSSDHLFALLGVSDLLIVQTDDATLIARKDQEESVRRIIERLQNTGEEKYL